MGKNPMEKSFVILWIEDQLFELQAGVDVLERLLRESLKQKTIILPAPTVADAEAELEKRKDNPPDVILLDLMLPRTRAALNAKRVDMNAGYFLWYRLRKIKEWEKAIAGAPIVVITARGNPEFRPAMEKDKNLRWLVKPVGPSEVANIIIEMVDSQQGSATFDSEEHDDAKK